MATTGLAYWLDTFEKVLVTAGACLKKSTLENTRSLQLASCNNDGITQMYGCKCSFGNNMPYIEISIKYIVYMQFMVANVLLRNTVPISIEEWLAATTLVK